MTNTILCRVTPLLLALFGGTTEKLAKMLVQIAGIVVSGLASIDYVVGMNSFSVRVAV
jgi:hypothetical protein